MESSDDHMWMKKNKEQMNTSGVADVPKKVKKKKKKSEDQKSDGKLVKNNAVHAGKNKPNWLEMTDSEEEFMPVKTKEESSKKLKKKKKPVDVQVNGNGIDVDEEVHLEESIITKISPKKRNAEGGIVTKRKKKRDSESSYHEHDVHEEYSSPKKYKKAKHDAADEEAYSSEHLSEKSPKKSPKKLIKDLNEVKVNVDDNPEEKLSPKKSKKKRREDPLKNSHENHLEGEGTSVAASLEHVPEEHPNKTGKGQSKVTNEEQMTANDDEETSSPIKSKKKQKDGLTRITLSNRTKKVADLLDVDVSTEESPEHVSEEPEGPPKKPVKRQTKVPIEEHISVGDEYKMKSFREKACKNCDVNVKLKIKTAVRDMGTQTQESAILNWVVGRKVKKIPARVRKSAPVSRKERIILPTEGEECHYVTSTKTTPLSKELLAQLRDIKIELKEDPLPQHNVGSNNVCRPLTDKEKEEFEKYDRLITGTFDAAEDEIIVKNWKKFCKKHNWDVKLFRPFTVLRYRGAYYLPSAEQRRKFVQFLARGLPNRCLMAIHKRFKVLFSNHRTERYTPEEDQIILDYIEEKTDNNRNNFNDLAEKLNRSRASIWRRYKILMAEKEEQKV